MLAGMISMTMAITGLFMYILFYDKEEVFACLGSLLTITGTIGFCLFIIMNLGTILSWFKI